MMPTKQSEHDFTIKRRAKLGRPGIDKYKTSFFSGDQARRIDGIEHLIGEGSQSLNLSDSPTNTEQPRNLIITSGMYL